MVVETSGGGLPASSPVNRNRSLGNGKHCHQCRQNRDIVAACKNQRSNRPCSVKICNKCLVNRYGEKIEEVSDFEEWSCPKCRGICNCSVCMKRRGHQPTGTLIKTAKATGFSSVSEMLHKSTERTDRENVGADVTASLTNEVVPSPGKKGKENSFAGKLDANLLGSVEKNSENIKAIVNGHADDSTSPEIINQANGKRKANPSCNMEKKPKKMKHDLLGKTRDSDIGKEHKKEAPLPVGTDLTSVAGVDICAEDVGNALQFLEFCYVFEKILDMKKGEAEYVLEDLLHGQSANRGKFCLTVQFHMRLLSIILTDRGEKCARLSSSYGKNSWFLALKKRLSESRHIPKEPGMEFLEKADDYDTLNAREKLRVVNLLCDEVLGTEKLRNWIGHENSQFREKAKQAKLELLDSKDKEPIVSRSKSEAAQAHAQLVESNGMLLKKHRTCDAMRIQPIFIQHKGHVYWKLNCYGESSVLHQNVGKGDSLTLNEKWFTLDDEGKETIEKYISSSRRK